jgi:hypothetical protein
MSGYRRLVDFSYFGGMIRDKLLPVGTHMKCLRECLNKILKYHAVTVEILIKNILLSGFNYLIKEGYVTITSGFMIKLHTLIYFVSFFFFQISVLCKA